VDDIVNVLKNGISKDGSIVCPPMPSGPNGPFGGMSDADARDVAHFLLSLEPKENVLPNGCAIPVAPPSE
jgi:hypothetical protein